MKTDTALNDRFDFPIDPAAYDAIEIQGVRDINEPEDPTGTFCEVDNDNPEFFSVYLHSTGSGIECFGDFGTIEKAFDYANELSAKYQWPIYNYVKQS